MKKGSFFRKLLLYLLCACLLTAALTGVLAGMTSVHILTDRIARELTSRAVSLSALCTQFIDGNVVFDMFYGFLASELRGAHVYIYDAQGSLLLWSREDASQDPGSTYSALVARVLAGDGDSVTSVNWHRGMIAVGAPVYDNLKRINGAVVLAKPAHDVREAVW